MSSSPSPQISAHSAPGGQESKPIVSGEIDASPPQPRGKAGGQSLLGTDLWSNTRWQQPTEAVQILTLRTQTEPAARSQPRALGAYASAKSKVLRAWRKPRSRQPERCWSSSVLAKRSGHQPFPKAKRMWSYREHIFSE